MPRRRPGNGRGPCGRRGTCGPRRNSGSVRASRAAWPTRRHEGEGRNPSAVPFVAAALVATVAVLFSVGRPRRRLAAVIAPFAQNLKSERPCNRRSLDQLDSNRIAEAVGFAGIVADQGVARFLVAEIFGADRARRDEPVGAGIVELHEQSGPGHAGYMTFEGG